MSFDYKSEDPYFMFADLLSFGVVGNGKRVGNHTRGGEKRTNYADAATNWMFGIEGASGTRGAPKTFSEMTPQERLVAAMFNDGMSSETRREILSDRGLPARTSCRRPSRGGRCPWPRIPGPASARGRARLTGTTMT